MDNQNCLNNFLMLKFVSVANLRRENVLKRFKKIYVEITNVCNLSCSFCSEMKRPPEFMDVETFRNILDQITPFTDYIYLHVKGEPLLHPEIDKFLDLCHDMGVKVNLTTNGTLIHDAADKLFNKPALRQINFSLHSFDGNDQIESKDEYLNRIFSFIHQAIMQRDILISLRLWNYGATDTAENGSNKNREVFAHIEHDFDLPYKIDVKATASHGIKIAENVYLSQESEFVWPSLEQNENSDKGFCYALKTQAAILVDGTVVPCCLDGNGIISLGNVHTTDFSKIIEGERAEKIRRGFQKRELAESLCKRCTYRKRFDRI